MSYLKAAHYYQLDSSAKDWRLAIRRAAGKARYSNRYSAEEILRKAIDDIWWEEEDTLAGKLYHYLAWNLEQKSQYHEAKFWYEKAKIVHEQAPRTTSVTSRPGPFLYKPLGNIYTRLGENEKAEVLLRKAIEVTKDDRELVLTYGDLGIVFWNQDKNKNAIDTFDQGLKVIAQRRPQNAKGLKSFLLKNKARSLLELGRKEEAKAAITTAIQSTNDSDFLGGAYGILADVLEQMGEQEEATKQFNKSLRFTEENYTYYSREVAQALLSLGAFEKRKGRYDLALQHYQEALGRVIPDFERKAVEALPDSVDFYPENAILDALTLKGEVYFLKYLKDRLQEQYLRQAQRHIERAIQMEEYLRNNFVLTSSQLQILKDSHIRYQYLINILFERYKKEGKAVYLEQALGSMEKSRAVLLRQKIKAKDIHEPNDPLYKKVRSLERKIETLKEEWFTLKVRSPKDEKLDSLKAALVQAKENYHEAFQQLTVKYKNQQQVSKVSLSTIRQQLKDERQLFIEYFFSQQSDSIYAITITQKGGPQFHCLPLGEEFKAQLKNYLQQFRDWDFIKKNEGDKEVFDDFCEQGFQFYNTLLAPLLPADFINSIVIVRSGPLNYLPFEILLDKKTAMGQVRYDSLPYLIRKYDFSYPFSATTLLQKRKPVDPSLKPYLGFRPHYPVSKSSLSRVLYGKETVATIASLLGGDSLLNAQATHRAFLERFDDYRILHFHGHADAYDSNPLLSWLAFSSPIDSILPIAGDVYLDSSFTLDGGRTIPQIEAQNQALLFAYAMDTLVSKAQLVVLNGCETGTGALSIGEGVMSLARAFRASGCPSILNNLWKVEDESSAILTGLFFKELHGQKTSLAESLQQAKLNYLANETYNAHPAYWAALVLNGQDQNIELHSSFNWWWALALGLLLLLISYLVRRTTASRP
ncbi:MAG: CHAT domain-containing protein [Bacteroidota bacterium]